MFLPSKLKLLLPLENPLVVYPELANKIGLNEAIVLQQLHYWLVKNEGKSDHIIDEKVWCYNTIEDWQENFSFWSTSTIVRIFDNLTKKGLVIKDNHNKNKQIQTKWYTIDYTNLVKMFSENSICQNDKLGIADCKTDFVKMTNWECQNDKMYNITETNTENTTENIPENTTSFLADKKDTGNKTIDLLSKIISEIKSNPTWLPNRQGIFRDIDDETLDNELIAIASEIINEKMTGNPTTIAFNKLKFSLPRIKQSMVGSQKLEYYGSKKVNEDYLYLLKKTGVSKEVADNDLLTLITHLDLIKLNAERANDTKTIESLKRFEDENKEAFDRYKKWQESFKKPKQENNKSEDEIYNEILNEINN